VCPREPETAVHAAQTVSRLDDWTFMAFAESAQVGLYLTDAEGGCTYANPRWLEMAGLTMDEARGSGWMRGLHPEDRESIGKRWYRSARSEGVWGFDYRFVDRRGTVTWVHGTANPLRDDAGEIIGYVGVNQDITPSKQAYAALQRAAERTESMIASMQDGFSTLDAEGVHVAVNPALCEMTGFSPEELVGAGPPHPYWPPEEFETIAAALTCAERGEQTEFELTFMRKSGERFPVIVSPSIIKDAEGSTLLCFATVKDISARRRMAQFQATRAHLLGFATVHTLDELLEETLNEAERLTGSLVGFYHLVDPDQENLTLQQWSTRTKAEFCAAEGHGRHYAIADAGVWVDCVRERRPVIHNDYASLEHRRGLPEGHSPIVRELVTPVLRGETVAAVLGVGNKPTDYTTADVATISDIADLALEIAERKRTEEALRESEDVYRRVVQQAMDGIVIAQGEELVFANETFAAMSGYSLDELATVPWPRHVAAEERPWVVERARRRLAGETVPARYEIGMVRKDGSPYTVEVNAGVIEHGGAAADLVVMRDITERVRAERALRESEAMRDIAETVAHVGSWRWDMTTRKAVFSPETKRLFEADPADFGGDPWPVIRARVHPDDLPGVVSDVEECLRAQRAIPMEFRVVLPDGTERIIRSESTVERDESGEPTAIVGFYQDITDRRRFERELREANTQLRLVLEGAEAGVWDWDIADESFVWSPELFELFGLDPEVTAAGFESWNASLHPDDLESANALIKQALDEHTSLRNEYRVVRPDGEVRWVYALGRGVYDENGAPVRMTGICLDITDRKRAEQDLRETTAYLENLFDYANAPIIVWSPELRVTRFNHAFERLTGRRADEVVGEPLEVLFPADRAEESLDLVDRATSGERWDVVEIPIRRADGTVRTVLWNSATIYDGDGTTRRATIAQGQDITGRKRAEGELKLLNETLEQHVAERTRELVEANEQLAEANAAKTLFLRSMSHELRTPLNSVIGFSSIMMDGLAGEVTEEQRRQLAMINGAGRHLLALINDILDLSRIEAGRVNVVAEPLDVAELVGGVMESVGPAAREKGLELRVETCDPPCTLVSDRTKVHQILLNLVGNAVKYTDSGGVVLRSSCSSGPFFTFAVTDTGPGIPAEEQDRIFGEFTQTLAQPGERVEGTGLGLAISRALAASLGGMIELTSTVGEGSTFTLVLPSAPKEA
jgi:PAS domain S-box-containing protein